MSILDSVNSPKDIKKLSIIELEQLCREIREFMVSSVSQTGGHLASNLGVVELTVALHRVFNSPTDQIVFDVGHQCYTHKILTERKNKFNTLRQKDGISGFTRPTESEHDIFSSGHSSTSISECMGLAKAKQLRGEKGKVIAVIGDGALTGGLAYEALNNSGNDSSNLIVILNSNNMSISANVGSMAKNLTTIRTSPKYVTFKSGIQRWLAKIPKIGRQISRTFTLINTKIRKRVYNATFFEDLGFRYYGPVDGHDIDALIDVLNVAKAHNHSVLIHVDTVKGKGYEPAEKDPTLFHGIGLFDAATGKTVPSGKTFSSAFGETMCKFARNDSRICCVTAAMTHGTGLADFSYFYEKRLFDVGIAEQHAVTFCSGLARNGMVPVFAVYSTFLQRSYDQLIHDIAMQNLKVILAIDRAGFVGEDGESHQGIFDTSYINSVLGITIYAPAYYDELESMFYDSIYKIEGAAAVRYPRGSQMYRPEGYSYDHSSYAVFGDENASVCLVTYGREFSNCAEALEQLDGVKLIKLNRIKPIDNEAVRIAAECKTVIFAEEAIKSGGIGQSFAEELTLVGYKGEYRHICVNDEFVRQASVSYQFKKYRLDTQSVIEEVENAKGK